VLTIFSSPRPFTERRFVKIQMNAIKSWFRLEPTPRIILFGDERHESGIGTLAGLGCEIVKDVRRNRWGTPLVGSLLMKAQRMAQTDIVAWINTDMIMLRDFAEAIRVVRRHFRQFLLIGAKWRLYGEPPEIDFSSPDWQRYVRELCDRGGDRQPRSGSNYHAFTNGAFRGRLYERLEDRPKKHLYKDFPVEYPPIAWGRIRMDTWLVWQMLRRDVPVVDATDAILAVHQDHRHFENGRVIDQDPGTPEIRLQKRLAERRISGGGRISNATWELTKEGLKKR